MKKKDEKIRQREFDTNLNSNPSTPQSQERSSPPLPVNKSIKNNLKFLFYSLYNLLFFYNKILVFQYQAIKINLVQVL